MHIYPRPVTSKQGGLHKQGDRSTNPPPRHGSPGGWDGVRCNADEGQEGGLTARLKVKRRRKEEEEEEEDVK